MSFQRWLRLAFWAAVVFTFVMATLPQPPALPATDKILHAVAFGTLALLASLAFTQISSKRLLLVFAMFGALIEVAQMIPALHRDAEVMDWVADMVAVSAVLLVGSLWRRLQSKLT